MSFLVNLTKLSKKEIENIKRDLLIKISKVVYGYSGRTTKIHYINLFISNRDDTANLPFNYCLEHCPKAIIENSDARTMETLNPECNVVPRDYQVEVLRRAREDLAEYRSSILILHCGFGKTLISCMLACECGLKTFVLCPNKVIAKSWISTIRNKTNCKAFWVEDKDNPLIEDADFIISLPLSLKKLGDEVLSWCGLLVIDEAHLFTTSIRMDVLSFFKPLFVVVCTATPDCKNNSFDTIELVCGNRYIYRKSDKPFLVKKVYTKISTEVVKREGETIDWTSIVNSLSANEDRNIMIGSLILNHPHNKIIVIVPRVEQAKVLYDLLKLAEENVDIITGKSKSYNDSRVLIGTHSKVGVGFDEESFCDDYQGIPSDMLIFCHSFSDSVPFEQVIGRVFRSNFPTIIHLCDDMHIFKRHWATASKWYTSRNGVIEEYRFDDEYNLVRMK